MMRIKKLWLATIAVLWCSMTVSAQEFEVDDISYTITSSSTVEVFRYWGEDDVVVIPSTIDGGTMSMFQEPTIYRVTSIGERAFSYCSSLTSIIIPSSVTSIGNYAFEDCSNLTSITIPASVTSIGDDAFYGCENLKTVTNYSTLDITKGSTDNGYVGYYAEHVIDRSVDEIIDDYAFTTIDGVHFLSCYVGVDRELCLPNNYRGEKYQIGEFAFYNCNQFTSITIPKGVTGIGESAFEGCGGELTVNCNIPSGAFRRSNFDKVVIGESVTSIGSSAFYDCSSLTAITLPKSVTSIGESAFEGCGGELTVNCNIPSGAFRRSNFDKVVIGEGVTSIGESAFEGCSNIASIICFATIPPTIEGSDAFPDVDKSIPIYVPNSEYLNADGWKEFTNFRFESPTFCQGRCGSDLTWRLTYDGELIIEGTGEMYDYCFPTSAGPSWMISLPPWYGYDVERVTINEGVTSIGEYAFCGVNLSYITLPKSLTYIAYEAFCCNFGYQSYIKTIINYSDLNIQKGSSDHGCVGYNADKVINVDEFIDGYAFKTIDGVHHLTDYIGDDTELALPEDCHDADYVIAESAFQGNEDIVSVKIPQTVGSIGNRAFYGCSSLTSVEFKGDVESIGSDAFYGTAWYNNQPDGELYIGKVLYDYKGTMPANTSIKVKEGVISISGSAFYNCSGLTSITIPSSVTGIGDDAFYGCENLKMVINYSDYFTIEKGSSNNGCVGYYADRVINVDEVVDGYAFNENELVAYFGNDTGLVLPNDYHGEEYRIGEYVFHGRSNLTSITIPEGVTSIGERAFYDCSSLTSITIPASVTSIGDYAFYGCSSLKTVINYSDLTIQKGSNSNGYVGYYADRVVNADEIIDGYAFRTINGICYLTGYMGDGTELTLPEDYHDDDYVIAEMAFQGNEAIVSVEIPQTVGTIGNSAFAGCINLASVEMARGVMSIEEKAFENCTSLSSVVIPQNMRSIGNSTFAGCSSLASVVFKEGVESIGDNAFEDCVALTEVVFPKSLTAIGANAFKGCSGITNLIVDKNVESFGDAAFEGCTAVKTLIVKGSVMPTVPSSALITIVLYSPHPLEATEFTNKVYRDATVYVPTGSLARYQDADVWKNFWTIKEFDSTQEMGISINETALTLTEGESFTLTATITPEFVADMAVTWSTSDASVAMVDEQGEVTTLTAGTATITVTAGNMQATCVVTVKSKVVAVSGITLSQSSATLTEGESISLTATVTPEDADNTSVTWSSSDEDVAMVSNKGKVVAMGLGTATITATANDGSGVSASCEIIVKAPLLGKCTKPSISYENGEVVFTCTTEGAEIRTTVITENDNEFVGTRFEFIPTHTFTAYATKEQYEDSDEVTLTLCWIPCDGNHATTDATSIPAKPVLISTQGGSITVSGLAAGTAVAAYSTAGTSLATATATDGTATLDTNLEAGSIAIVKIGDYSIKVAIR